jgi:hypothetical protein
MNSLKVRYDHSHDDDDFGQLHLAVKTQAFSGRGRFWVQWQDVEELAEKLNSYPLSADDPPRAVWGYNDCQGDNVIIALEVKPINTRGTLRTSVEIADYDEPGRRVRTYFHTHYPQVAEFAAELLAVMRRERDEAELRGE